MNLDRVSSGPDVPNEINVIKDLDEGERVRAGFGCGHDEARKEIMNSVQMNQDAQEKQNF